MGLSLEVSGATCEALVALPRAGIGSTDLVPPAGLMSAGGLASVVPAVSVHRDFWPPPFGRLVPTARSPAVLSFSAPPSPRADRVLLTSVGDFRTVSSFSKSSTRRDGHRSRISVFLHQIPSLARQERPDGMPGGEQALHTAVGWAAVETPPVVG